MVRLSRLRRSAYTGANRCWPCTAVNVVILAVLVAALAAFRPLGAAFVGLAGSVVIWQRGYLVPYTPKVAPRLVSTLPGVSGTKHARRTAHLQDLQDLQELHDLDGADGRDDAAGDPAVVLEALVAAGVVVPVDETLGVAETFAADWEAEMDELAAAPAGALADRVTGVLAGVSSARVEDAGSETFLVVSGGSGSTAWVHRPLAIAEVAAAATLARTSLPAAHRGQAAHALCAFLETCPVCAEDLVEGPASDCCGNTAPLLDRDESVVLACERCGVPFYTFDGGDDHDER